MEPAALDALLALMRANLRIVRIADARIGAFHGLSAIEFALLRAVAAAPSGRIRPVDLARQLHLTPSGITRMLGPLERRGIVERPADDADRRSLPAALTPAGERLLSDAAVAAAEAAENIFRRLSVGQTRQLIRLLEEL